MSAEEGKKKKFYFLPRMDILLIMEVLQQNPYRNGNSVYGLITHQLRQREEFRDVERRTLQDRVDRLLKSFRNEQLQSMRRSGTEEEYDKRERLLQDLSDLEKEWTTYKRPATATAADVPKKAAKQHAVGRPMLQGLATPLRPIVTLKIGKCPAVSAKQVPDPEVVKQEERAEGVSNDLRPLAAVNDDGQDKLNEAEQAPNVWLPQSISPAAGWSTTVDYMRNKLEKEEESKKTALEVQKEELKLKKEELEVRKMEAANERLRIEAQQREQQRRADMEEERRKEEREERKLMMDRQKEERKEMMDRQDKLMDAMLQLIQADKK